MTQNQALATRDDRLMAIKQTLSAKRESIVGMIGDDRDAQRLVASAMLIVADDQKILNCEPETIVRSVLQAATLGLDLAGALGEAYLVPRGGVCCLDVGYRGWQRKVHEAGYSLIASAVFEGEEFHYTRAPVDLHHRPALSEKHRGEFIGSYAAAYSAGVLSHVEWATPEDIERAKKMSRSPAWPGWPDRMRRKLAIKRLGKEIAAGGSEIIRRLVEVASTEDMDNAIAGIDDPMERLLATPDPATAVPKAGVSDFGRRGGKDPAQGGDAQAPAQGPEKDPPSKGAAKARKPPAAQSKPTPDPLPGVPLFEEGKEPPPGDRGTQSGEVDPNGQVNLDGANF